MNTPISQPLVRLLLWIGVLSLLVRTWIGATFPITGDEAYFYWWGVYPDWGYYDHPPMAGWLIAVMLRLFGDSTLAMRIPALLLPTALGAALWWGFSGLDREKTAWAIVLYWLTPINWLNALITTDTPLIFWSALSVCALVRAEQRAQRDHATYGLYALSGLCLGLAFLSKYFAVVMGLAYLVYFVAWRRERLLGFVLLVLAATPGSLINLWWNMGHGWANIMFNVYNRNQGEVFEWHKPALYLLTWVYLLTPGLVWLGWKDRQALVTGVRQNKLLVTLVAVPFAFFALIAMKKVVGLHWVLNFYPLFFVLLALALPTTQLKRCSLWMGVFLGAHLVALVTMYSTHLADWKGVKIYPEIVRSYRTQALLAQVQAPDTVLMATSYTPASIYGQTLKTYVPVFGAGSFHARQDDLLVNFADFDGKTIRIIGFSQPNLDEYRAYFDSVSLITASQDEVPFYAVEGKHFKWRVYRDTVLKDIFQQRHQIPSWLPMTGCPFCQHYCGQVRCDNAAP
ncbi:glycosyltransferase family 39 protein [Limnohabitans sp.]|uniref:ArnT family glycosyltransferase n=1 Tax=Limnohabitans sp. TaxID=1907725 RepID=UPI00286F8FFD|nr:glycosyltransferase family 39 protein [Limnohabitans sp.]